MIDEAVAEAAISEAGNSLAEAERYLGGLGVAV